MTELTYGDLFAGYDGLGMGVRSVLGGESRWFAEFDAAPSKILAHHYPDVPNLGDVTKVDWTQVEPVDVITGGSPCQDLSHAGKRKGMTHGTRSNLWAEMREAIAVIRPRLVVWENVRGALSAPADSALEQCPGCVGGAGGDGQPVLRALGRVVGDLAELGFVGRYYGLRAADVGAAHGRFRIFLFAHPVSHAGHDAGSTEWLLEHALATARARESGDGTPADAGGFGWGEGPLDRAGPGSTSGAGQAGRTGGHRVLLGVDAEGLNLLPTPAVNDMGASYTPETWDAWTERMKSEHGNGNGHGKSLSIEALRLLPTPSVADVEGGRKHRSGERSNELLLNGIAAAQDWREYGPAIARAERALGRPAPAPTELGAKGQPRLSPKFVEFLMMLPEGWVTGVPGISRNDMLKALGNGVVPPQSAAATLAFVQDTAREQVAS